MSVRKTTKILCMEDNKSIATLFKLTLEKKKYDVTIASDGEEGLALIKSQLFDFVIIDYQMPGCTGLDVLNKLKDFPTAPPIIMISGEGNEEIAVEAMKLGACDYIVKDAYGYYLKNLPSIIERLIKNDQLEKEKLRTEKALIESEKRYRELVEQANSIILRMDVEGNITYINEYAQKFFGYTEHEILNKNVIGTIITKTSETSRKLKSLLDNIQNNPNMFINIENENITKDGSLKWITWSNKYVAKDDNNTNQILSIGIDISKRKQAEQLLAQALQSNITILEAMPIGVAIVTEEHKIRYANKSMLEMLESDANIDIIDKQCFDVICSNNSNVNCPIINQQEKYINNRGILKTFSNKTIHVIHTVLPVVIENEKVFIETFVNINELQNIENKLRNNLTDLALLTHKLTLLQQVIQQYTPRYTWEKAENIAEAGILEIPEEEKELTIVFGDLVNFTKFSENLSPKEVIDKLNTVFKIVTREVYLNNGDIDKFIGDAFLATFDSPINATLTAIKISNYVNDLNLVDEEHDDIRLLFRIGINTGKIIRGNIGGSSRKDNTIIGDGVNIAQRLESSSTPGKVLISEATYKLVKDYVKVSNKVILNLKGREEPVTAFYVEDK